MSLQDILSGNFLTNGFFKKQYKLLILIAVLFFIYIANGYRGQEQQQRIRQLQNEIIEARTIMLDLSTEYTTMTRPSYIGEQLKKNNSPVREATEPAIIIE